MGRRMKKKTAEVLLIVNFFLIVLVVAYGVLHRADGQDAENGGNNGPAGDSDVYYLDGHDLAEFSEVIVERFNKESELTVWSADASVSLDLKQAGIWDLDILNKTQRVTYTGSGRFYVDFSMLGEYAVSLDNESYVVTIQIPHAKLAEIEIDPDKFICEEPKRGLLAFGELKFTFKEYNELEAECKKRMQAEIDTPENYEAADQRAVEELKKIFEPVVKAVDDAYHVEIVFMER